MKNKFKKLISLLLVFSMTMQNITVFADVIKENINEITSNLKNDNEENLYEVEIENSEQLEQEDEMEDVWAEFNETEHKKNNSITDFFMIEKQTSIKTVEDLIDIKNDLSGSYILENDIDLDNELWQPIGNESKPFTGSFDGNGYEISNLKINSRQKGIGFFGVTDNAIIKNITLSNIEIEAFNYSTGAIVGYSKETELMNIGIIGNINMNNPSSHGRLGGFIGESYQSNITNCYVSGFGNLYTTRSGGAGFIGRDIKSIINRCFAEGISIKIGFYHIGGFIGTTNGSEIYNSYSTCKITPNNDGSGFIFNLSGDTIIENCYYAADVKYPLYGSRNGSVQVNNSYFDKTKSGVTTQPKHGRTTFEMMKQSTYEGWNFEDIWKINEGEDYPTLQNLVHKGAGTKENPYQIRTVQDLENITKDLNAFYKLQNDIDLSGIEWKPLGDEQNPFKGAFDGNDFTIKNLTITNRNDRFSGLFGLAIGNVTISNLNLENANISGNQDVGAILGYGQDRVEIKNCSVVGGTIKGKLRVGGLVGELWINGLLSESFSNNIIEGGSNVGGIAGAIDTSQIENCYSLSDISGKSEVYGITSNWASGRLVENSYFAGTISSNNGISNVTNRNSYFDKDISGATLPAVAAKTTSEMMMESTYEGWNFQTVWNIDEGKGYPYLRAFNDNDDNPIASEASIKKVITPKNSVIKDNKINILVSKNTSKSKLELEVTKGAIWSLYKDEETKEEIDNKDILLASNTNTFYIKLKDQDDKNKIYELVIEKTDEIPSTITGFSGVPKDGKVYLSWDVGYEANVSSYTIYKSDSFDGDYKELKTINDRFTTTHIDTEVILDKTYYYKIVSENKSGNTSDYSEIVIVSMGLDEVLPVILSFSPQNNSSISNVTNLEIKAEDNILLSKIILEYLKDDKWVEVQSKTINNKQGTGNFNISSIEDLVDGEEIKLRALAVDSYGNISDPGIERTFKVKTSEPNKVLNVTSEPFQTRVLLKWSDTSDDDFDYFVVEQKNSVNGEFKQIGKTDKTLGYEIKNLKANTTYWFRVCIVDKYGNKGEYSSIVSETTLPDNLTPQEEPKVVSILPKPAFFKDVIPVRVTATGKNNVTKIKVFTSENNVTWELAGEKTVDNPAQVITETVYIDTMNLSEGKCFVKAIAVDSLNKESEDSTIVEHIIDRIPPETPWGLTSSIDDYGIEVKWKFNEKDTSLNFFTIYRAKEIDDDYEIIGDNILAKSLIDNTVKFEKKYFYKIKGTDFAGNESELSEVLEVTMIPDKLAPEILSIAPKKNSIITQSSKISALVKDNNIIDKVFAYYQHGSEEWKLLGEVTSNKKNDVFAFDVKINANNSTDYNVKIVAIDKNNNQREQIAYYSIDLVAPVPPALNKEEKGWQINLSWDKAKESDFSHYELYRSTELEGKYSLLTRTLKNDFEDKPVDPSKTFYYKLRVYDLNGNFADGDIINGKSLKIDNFNPEANIRANATTKAFKKLVFDASLSTDNDGIAKYEWDFGDGTISEEEVANHSFSEEGERLVKLKVTDFSGNLNVQSKRISVFAANAGTVVIDLKDEKGDGSNLTEAMVLLEESEGKYLEYYTDNNASLSITKAPGIYDLKIFKEGYLPISQKINIVEDHTENINITLNESEIIVSDLEVKRLTLEEIIDYGIDINDPDNQHIFKFELRIILWGEVFRIESIGNTNFIHDKTVVPPPGIEMDPVELEGVFDFKLIPNQDIPVLIGSVGIPGSISWLKEFFEAKYIIMNAAEEEFVLENLELKLDIPEGLSLAKTTKEQSEFYEIPELKGQETKEITWVLRGDKEGLYDFDVDIFANLLPFNKEINFKDSKKERFDVRGGTNSGLKIYAQIPDQVQPLSYYQIPFLLVNEGEFPLYNVKASFGKPNKTPIIKDPILAQYIKVPEALTYIVDENDEVIKIISDGRESTIINKNNIIHHDNSLDYSDLTFKAKEAKDLPIILSGESMIVETFNPGDYIQSHTATFIDFCDDFLLKEGYQIIYSYVMHFFNQTNEDESDAKIPFEYEIIPTNLRSSVIKAMIEKMQKMRGPSPYRADPVNTFTGGYEVIFNAFSALSSKPLPFDLRYDSTIVSSLNKALEKITNDFEEEGKKPVINGKEINFAGETGSGWFHNYESKVSKAGYGKAIVNWSPYFSEEFYDPDIVELIELNNDDDNPGDDDDNSGDDEEEEPFYETRLYIKRRIRGKFIDDKTIELIQGDDIQTEPKSYYRLDDEKKLIELLVLPADKGFEIRKYSTGIKDGSLEETVYFDKDGNVIGSKSDDYSIDIDRTVEKQMTISEKSADQKLTIKYNDLNLISEITDGEGNYSKLYYDDSKRLIKIKLPDGSITRYYYDENGFIISEVSSANETEDSSIVYLTNTYDDDGKVLTQDDARDDNELTRFKYFEDINPSTIGIVPNNDTAKINLRQTTVTDRNGAKENIYFNVNGQIVKLVDNRGNGTFYYYDEKGLLEKTINPDGSSKNYKYDENGNIIKEIDEENVSTSMEYNDKYKLIKVYNEEGQALTSTYDSSGKLETQTSTSGVTTQYKYDSKGNLVEQTIEGIGTSTMKYENGFLVSTTDAFGNTSNMTFKSNGTVESVHDSYSGGAIFEVNGMGQVTSVTNDLGENIQKEYDTRGNVVKTIDARGNVSRSYYDGNRNLIKGIDGKNNVVTFTYDGEDRIKTLTDSLGRVTSYDYDANGNILKMNYPRVLVDNDGDGINETSIIPTEEYTYDSRNNVKSIKIPDGNISSFEYLKNGKLKSVTDISGETLTYEYDSAWRITKTTTSKGKSVEYYYDAGDNITHIKNGELDFYYEYDKFGNLLSIKDAKGHESKSSYTSKGLLDYEAEIVDGVEKYKIKYEYNTKTQLVKAINALGDYDELAYDSLGRVSGAIDKSGRKTSVIYDQNSNIKEVYDADGNLFVRYYYDEIDQLIGEEDGTGVFSISVYDGMGRVIKVIEGLPSLNYPDHSKGKVTEVKYDDLDRIIEVKDPEGNISKQTYDSKGYLKTVTDTNGGITVFEYDSKGNMTKSISAVGSTNNYKYNSDNLLKEIIDAKNQHTEIGYDYYGRVSSVTDELGKVDYSYDKNSNVIEIKSQDGITKRDFDDLNRVTRYTDSKGRVIGYSYNEIGLLDRISYPDGKFVTYQYTSSGELYKVGDWAGRTTTYAYDGRGRLSTITHANGVIESMTYDLADRLKTKIVKDGKGQEISSYGYDYDVFGNIISEDGINFSELDGITNSSMEYDSDNRLIKYNNKEVKYDANGNMIYGPLNGAMVNYEYDCRNRLVKAGTTTYEYNSEDLRTAIVEDGSRTDYVINPSSLSQVLSKNTNGIETFYVYGLGLIGQEENNEFKTYHYDLRGSTTHLTNEDGEVTDKFSYGPYGELLGREGTTDVIFLYNGRDGVITDKNNLYYMRARFYNPEIKRFINQDIIFGNITNSQSLNRYSYVQGNPVSYIDPFGLSPQNFGASSMITHIILSIGSMIPGPIGTAFGLANSMLYFIEGDIWNGTQALIGSFLQMTFIPCNFRLVLSAASIAMDVVDGALGVINAFEAYLDGNYGAAALSIFFASMNFLSARDGAVDIKNGYFGGEWGLCFTGDTLVYTISGHKPIADIKVGDEVYSYDFENDEMVVGEVEEILESETSVLYNIIVDGERIKTTKGHPFYLKDKGWVKASDLEVGDILVTDDEEVEILQILIEYLAEPIIVYNFTVKQYHNYFVTDLEVLTHNVDGKCTTELVDDNDSKDGIKNPWNKYQNERKISSDSDFLSYVDWKLKNGIELNSTESKRLQYLGATPGKNSKTGREVIARMYKAGKIEKVDGVATRFQASNGKWYPIKEADMSHITDAVTWWNKKGRKYVAKSEKVREFMLNSDNYELDLFSINRSAGAKLKETYKPPLVD